MDAKENIASLSNNVYNCVKKYIVLSNSYTDVSLAQQGSQEIGPQHSAVNQSVCSMVNLNSDSHTGSRPGKRRSNSNLDEYFREKFGSPAKDVSAY